MRKRTLVSLGFLLSLLIVYGLTLLARSQGIRLPLAGFVSHVVAALVVTPVLMILLTKVNRPLLEWRKKRGRDIEEEERYEIEESDIISLRPRRLDDERSR